MPLKIDPQTLNLYHGIFARVPVEIDCSYQHPGRILVQRKNKENKVEEDFFVNIRYKNLPQFCRKCCKFGNELLNYPKDGENHPAIIRNSGGALNLLNGKKFIKSDNIRISGEVWGVEEHKQRNTFKEARLFHNQSNRCNRCIKRIRLTKQEKRL